MKKLLLILIPLLAFIGGAVGGDLLHKPSAEAAADAKHAGGTTPPEGEEKDTAAHGEEVEAGSGEGADATAAYFKFPNQFFIPIMRNGSTMAIMVMSLSLETPTEALEGLQAQELPLRDALLNTLMIEANTGAFDGNFTAETTLSRLRNALLKAAQQVAGDKVKRVLIEDIARQDQ